MDVDLPAALPSLQNMMMQAYPDLKAAQVEALTRLTHQPLGEATYAIRGFLSDKAFLELVEKMKPIDPDLAEYLRKRDPQRIRVNQLTFPGQTAAASESLRAEQSASAPFDATQPTAGTPGQASAGAMATWHADPTRRHELRYWDGQAWTANVADQGMQSTDPIGG
ncbi:MAG: DUF2510 domain-containing protein [Candidatus Nanopelagicales bacterium]